MATITAQEFAQIMRDAIAQIQPAVAAAPVVKVEAPAAPDVEVDVEGIIAQLRAMRGTMVRPSNLRGIVQQVKELQTVSKQNTRQIVAAIETLANTTPEQTDIQPIVDELLEITGGLELLGEDVRAATQEVANVADIMNPYRGLTRQEILDEFRRIGFTNLSTLSADTQDVLSRKLNIVKAIDEQAEALEAYKTRTPAYIASDFSRSSFDTFVKTTEVSRTNTPLEQTYKFIPREIPEAHIKFIPERGLYELRQAGKIQYVKSFRDAERWALMGGEYATEMKELRRIRAMTERREVDKHIIFKARKV